MSIFKSSASFGKNQCFGAIGDYDQITFFKHVKEKED